MSELFHFFNAFFHRGFDISTLYKIIIICNIDQNFAQNIMHNVENEREECQK